jgi:hypothetical protein
MVCPAPLPSGNFKAGDLLGGDRNGVGRIAGLLARYKVLRGNLAIVQTDDGLDDIRQRAWELGGSGVTVVFAARRIIVLQHNGEGLVHCCCGTAHDDGAARRITLDHFKALGFLVGFNSGHFGGIRAVAGGELRAGNGGARHSGLSGKFFQLLQLFALRRPTHNHRRGYCSAVGCRI